MKKLSGCMEMSGRFRSEQRSDGSGYGGYFSFTAAILLFGLVIFGVLNCRTHLIDEAERLNTQAARVSRQIEEKNREIANMRVRRQQLTAYPYISERIAKSDLALRAAVPSQTRSVILLRRDMHHSSETHVARTR